MSMSKFDKKTIASALALATFLGNKTSAVNKNEVQNPQAIRAVSSNSEKAQKTKSMSTGAKVAKIASVVAAAFGTYIITNEVLGDTDLVNHHAMGRFTFKKTIGYFSRDVKKEEALIDRIIEFIDKLGTFNLDKINLDMVDKNAVNAIQQELIKAQNEVVIKNEKLIPGITMDMYSIDNSPLDIGKLGGHDLEEKSIILRNLLFYRLLLAGIKARLAKMKFSEYSCGYVKFNLSKNSVFIDLLPLKSMGPGLFDNIFVTLNENGSLTIKQSAKQLNMGLAKLNNITTQFTIPDPALATKK